MDSERVELEADIEKLHHTLEEDRNQWQYDYIVDSDDDSDEDDALYIDLDKHGSATASVASLSARSAGGRTTPSIHSMGSHPTTETQSVLTEQDDDTELFREVGVMMERLDSTSSLPATFESCLVINRTYQEIIKEHITRIELELAENREAQRRLEEEAKDSSLQQITKKRFPYTTNLPYFKMRYGSTPKPNEDVQLKRLAQEPDLDTRPDTPWYQRHKGVLMQAVTEDALEKFLQPLLCRRELEEEKLTQVAEKSEQWYEICSRIALIDQEIEEKKGTPQEQLLRDVDTERVDWMKIANIVFHGKRDWTACRRAWQHSVDPKLNQDKMKPEEEQRLASLIKETNGSNWVYIAQQLGTGRTAFQCLQYYQQHLNTEMLSRPWTKEEDKQLLKVVERCQQYHFNWSKVSQYMEGRSSVQCYKRFNKLDPSINKGFWTEVEDAQLMAAVQLLGSTNWGRVSELVPGRTREQCRERYINSLDPKISGQPWTYEEDKRLLQLVQKYGTGCWVKMCKDLPGRTDNQILQRYRRLEDWSRKSEWFKKQPVADRELFQGNNLPADQKQKAQERNWEQFKDKFAVYPEDYRKQQIDIENGGLVVPRPPFMLGLANKTGSKVWERRIKLHKLIEGHINRLKEEYNFTNPTVTGIFELQGVISQLSQDCINKRDQLMNMRKDRLGQLIHDLPSAINVKDLLAVSRGGKLHPRKQRGPLLKKRSKGKGIAARLHKSMKIDSELRKVVRANLKDRSMKKGRPRRFFWDISGDQKLSDEDMDKLKATTLSLYLKSLAADHIQLLVEGRKTFPELFHKLQVQRYPPPREEDRDQPGPSGDGQSLRRSRRARRLKKEEAEEPENSDPFSLAGQPSGCASFCQRQKQRDYQLLEWLAKVQDIDVDLQLSAEVSMDEEIPAASSVEVSSARGAGSAEAENPSPDRAADSDVPVVGRGMRLVHDSIRQAMEESEAQRSKDAAASGSVLVNGSGGGGDADNLGDSGERQVLTGGGGDAYNTMAANGEIPQTAHRCGGGGGDASSPSPISQSASPWPLSKHPSPRHTAPSGSASPGPQSPAASVATGARKGSNLSQRRSSAEPRRQLPNLPPTSTSLLSFKHLLLKRLGLIKTAGKYYNLSYYLAQKDNQIAQLIQAGNKVQELNRGSIDLSRMMNRVSQVTDFAARKKWAKKNSDASAVQEPEEAEDSKDFDFRVLMALRQTEDYQLLQSRFESLFIWPALLSAIYPPFQRSDYSDKAGGPSYRSRPSDPDAPHGGVTRKQPPLLKSKSFYKYANKTKEEKEEIARKRREKRILKQVQELMADESDPNPRVTMEPDSDDDPNMDSEPSVASMLAAQRRGRQTPGGNGLGSEPDAPHVRLQRSASGSDSDGAAPQPGPSGGAAAGGGGAAEHEAPRRRKKYRKRWLGASPMRQSSRVTERKTYSDRINKRRTLGPRRRTQRPESGEAAATTAAAGEGEGGQGRVAAKRQVRPARLPKYVRNAMIKAMVDMKGSSSNSGGGGRGSAKWNSGGYVSDDDVDDVLEEMESAGDWVVELPQDQQDSMAQLQQESIVDNQLPLPSSGGTADTGGASVPADRTSLPFSSAWRDAAQLTLAPPGGSGSGCPLSAQNGETGSRASAAGGLVAASPSCSRSGAVQVGAEGAPLASPAADGAVRRVARAAGGGAGPLAGPAVPGASLLSAFPPVPPRPEVLELDSDSENEPTVASLLAARDRAWLS